MVRREQIGARAGGSRIAILLLALVLLLGAASSAQGADCSDYPGGVLDGFAGTPAPSQLNIDQNCTIRNYPGGMSTNISFFTQPGQEDERWLVIFDNVVHTGQMSCNAVQGHKIWFVNGSSSGIHANCQNLLIPVEKIDKKNPTGQTTAAIGVPFTYTLTIPVLFDPATGTVIDNFGSPNDLHSITIWDDLNETGVDLTYVSHVASWEVSGGAPVPHTFSNVGGLLTFEIGPIIPANAQIVIEITVVLEDTPANAPGTQFINTAKWDFGRLIDDVFYEPLPGEWGISPPLTIAAPQLVVTKTGPATLGRTLNLGQWGQFTIDVQNTGLGDAWDVTILDRLPDGPTGGMCNLTPEVLSAQVFAADGVTPVPGKGPLVPGTDFSLAYAGAPTCELTLTMLTAAAAIGPSERLVITYRTQLDADSQDGITLTNVVGATEWFNDDDGNPSRVTFTRTLTDGTVGVLDHEDAHTVAVELFGYFFEKSVANLTTGVNPTATAAAGDRLRYTLRLQATDVPLDDVAFQDDLGALNASPVFVPGSLALVPGSIPPGADTSNTDPNGGTNGAGILDVRNLDVPANGQILIQFEITLDPTLADGTVVLNQADLLSTVKIADSDDPNVNGQADPAVPGDEDPTRVVIQTPQPAVLVKANTQATATIGEEFRYRITVPETPYAYPMYDVRITDDLTASNADLRFVSVAKISGSGAWTPVNTGTDTNLVIEDPAIGIDIPAGEQVVVEITVVLEDTATNAAGLEFTNTADYTFNRIDEDDASQRPGSPGTSPPMTIVEPGLTLEKSGPAQMTVGTPETFSLDVHNASTTPAWNATILDRLPDGATGGTCDAAPIAVTAQVFEADGTTPVSPPLVQGTDFTMAWSGAPGCELTLAVLTAAGTIGADQRLIVTYQTELDADTQNAVTLTNVAGATRWFSAAPTAAIRRTYTRAVTDGTVGVLDHEDAHTVGVALPVYFFEKTVANVTSGANPATTAAPGDTLRYRLRLQNTTALPLADLAFVDELDALNTPAAFQAGTLQLVTVPPGADTSNTSPTGGAKGTGVVDVRSLGLAGVGELVIEFDVTLATTLVDGSVVTDQAQLSLAGAPFALSDDPNVNGQADPFVAGDEDPTRVTIQVPAASPLQKANTQATATIGEEFRYRITVPETPYAYPMYDVRITDDLTASSADLRFVGVAKISGSGAWTPVNTGTDTNLVIEDPAIGIDIPAGEQVVVEITVVLEDTATNAAGLTFTNTADYTYNRLDEDDASQLPGLPGTTQPMTIVEPGLTLEKSGPVQMTIGTPETFTLDVHNPSTTPAWNATILDRLPDGATGGMCDGAPTAVTAQVFQADGTTPVSPPLVQGIDFTLAWSGSPACELSLTILTPAGTVGADQRLIVTYQTELDAGTQNGVALTNVAGATGWFSAEASATIRRTYARTLTDGTLGVLDHEDAHTVGVALPVYFFEKTVANVTSGANPATTAAPGHTLRYRLRLQSTSAIPIPDLAFVDDLDALNAPAAFQAGTLQLVTVPPGADTSATSSSGGSKGTGLVDVRNLSLAGVGELVIEFEITLATTLVDGTVVSDQAQLLSAGAPFAISDDPGVNGQADPFVAGDEDPTRITIDVPAANALQKANTQATATIGVPFRYQITVPQAPYPFPLYDVRITDDLTASSADLRFVGVAKISGSGAWTPVNTGTDTNLVIEDPTLGIDIPAGEQVVVEITVVLEDTATNAAGLTFTNTADYTYNRLDEDDASQLPGLPGTTQPMTIVEPGLTLEKSGPAQMTVGTPETFTLDVHNPSTTPAWNLTILDRLPDGATGGTCDAAPTAVGAQLFLSGGAPSTTLVPGTDFTVAFSGAPACEVTLTVLTAAGTIGPDERLVVTYQTELDANTQNGVALTNVAGATGWFGAEATATIRRSYTRTLTDGTPGVLDHEDAHTVGGISNTPSLFAVKAVELLVDAGTPTAVDPGDVLRYTITITNSGGVAATGVTLTDGVPANTTYVADSVTLNGLPVGQPDLGVFPLAAGIPVSSTDLTPPLPAPGAGTISPGASAVAQFDLRVNDGVPGGTVISNQAVVTSAELPNQPTDGDGDPTTGPEPTVVVVTSGLSISKTTPSKYVSRGQLVPYEISVNNPFGVAIADLGIVDRFPAGFHYVEASARVDGVALEPSVDGRQLTWSNLAVAGSSRVTLRLLLAVGAGVGEGEYVNRAQAISSTTGLPLSGEATAKVRVIPDPTFACTDVMGKVFDDANRNGIQDGGEKGLAGVRLVTARGLVATTDPYGRYHITCAITPNESRGSNFVLKLDDRTLPSGYRMSSRPLQVQRATRGKALRVNYAASIHRVVSLDLADGVFEPGSTEIRPQWRPRLDLLLEELRKGPATLRLSYIADVEDEGLVERRLAAVEEQIAEAWEALDSYELAIEPETFWRRGAPPARPRVRAPESR